MSARDRQAVAAGLTNLLLCSLFAGLWLIGASGGYAEPERQTFPITVIQSCGETMVNCPDAVT